MSTSNSNPVSYIYFVSMINNHRHENSLNPIFPYPAVTPTEERYGAEINSPDQKD